MIALAIILTACAPAPQATSPDPAPAATEAAPPPAPIPLSVDEVASDANAVAMQYNLGPCNSSGELPVPEPLALRNPQNKVTFYIQCSTGDVIAMGTVRVSINQRVNATDYTPVSTNFFAFTNGGVSVRQEPGSSYPDAAQILQEIGLDPTLFDAETKTVEYDLNIFTGERSNFDFSP